MIPYCNVSISIVCKMAFNSIEYPTVAILQYSTYNVVEFYEMYPGDQENDIFFYKIVGKLIAGYMSGFIELTL